MKLPIYQVDAFASEVFRGNPAAVVPYAEPLSTELMQSIAMENNLSETAFIQASGPGHYRIRWFTPAVEVDLCGHATLAAAWVVINELEPGLGGVLFDSGVGRLEVDARDGRLILDFPSRPPRPIEIDPALVEAMGKSPVEVLKARDLVLVYKSEAEVMGLRPDFGKLAAASTFGVLATAKGNNVDFVSRCFFPAVGIDEDPVHRLRALLAHSLLGREGGPELAQRPSAFRPRGRTLLRTPWRPRPHRRPRRALSQGRNLRLARKRTPSTLMKTTTALTLALLAPAFASAQGGDVGALLMADKTIVAALERAKANEPEIIAEQIRVCEIPAPPFREEKRGLEFKNVFEARPAESSGSTRSATSWPTRPGTGTEAAPGPSPPISTPSSPTRPTWR